MWAARLPIFTMRYALAGKSGKLYKKLFGPQNMLNLKVSHKGLTELLEAVERVKGVRRVFYPFRPSV